MGTKVHDREVQSRNDTVESIRQSFDAQSGEDRINMYRAFAIIANVSGKWPHDHFYVDDVRYELYGKKTGSPGA